MSALLKPAKNSPKVVKSFLFFLKFKLKFNVEQKHSLASYLHVIGKMCGFAFDLPHENQ